MEQRTISPEDVFWQLTSLNQRIARIEQLLELLPILLVAQVDPTHVSIDSAAKIVGVGTKTIRRRIRDRKLRLDVRGNSPHRQSNRAGSRWMVGSTRRPSSARPRTRIAGKEGGRTAAETAMRMQVSPLPPRSHTLPPKPHFGSKTHRLRKTRWQDVGKLAVLVNKKARDSRANFFVLIWLRGQDLNLRPLGYEGDFSDAPDQLLAPNINKCSRLHLTPFGLVWTGLS